MYFENITQCMDCSVDEILNDQHVFSLQFHVKMHTAAGQRVWSRIDRGAGQLPWGAGREVAVHHGQRALSASAFRTAGAGSTSPHPTRRSRPCLNRRRLPCPCVGSGAARGSHPSARRPAGSLELREQHAQLPCRCHLMCDNRPRE